MNTSMDTRQFVKVGDIVTVTLPHSEVCMFMKVAGQVRPVLVVEGGAQIMNNNGTQFSSPVTHGEAGIYFDAVSRRYYVPGHNVVKYVPRPQSTVVLFVDRVVGGQRIACAPEHMVQAVIDRFGRNCEVIYENDEMGRRFRVICAPVASALLNPPPAVRLANIAKQLNVPASIED